MGLCFFFGGLLLFLRFISRFFPFPFLRHRFDFLYSLILLFSWYFYFHFFFTYNPLSSSLSHLPSSPSSPSSCPFLLSPPLPQKSGRYIWLLIFNFGPSSSSSRRPTPPESAESLLRRVAPPPSASPIIPVADFTTSGTGRRARATCFASALAPKGTHTYTRTDVHTRKSTYAHIIFSEI